jgi:hypothetical protein
MEARFLSKCWKETGAEVVVAEFGPEPVVFRNESDLENIDCYVFCCTPWASPFACSWWKNVPSMFAKGETLIQTDCDIAMAPDIMTYCKTPPQNVIWPSELGQSKAALSEFVSFSDVKRSEILGNYEQVLIIRKADFLAMNGWPEWYTGRKHTFFLLNNNLNNNGIACSKFFPFNAIVHVPHLNFYQNQYNSTARTPIGNHSNTWTFEKNGYSITSSNARWPLPNWPIGNPTMLEFWIQSTFSTANPSETS